MASDFCYVATGQPGLGLGQGVLGEGRLADGPGAAGAEVEPLGFNSSTGRGQEGRGWTPLGSLCQGRPVLMGHTVLCLPAPQMLVIPWSPRQPGLS